MKWTANDIPDQTGRRVVITGGNSGIGFHAALELARRGAEVISSCMAASDSNPALFARWASSSGRLISMVVMLVAPLSEGGIARFPFERPQKANAGRDCRRCCAFSFALARCGLTVSGGHEGVDIVRFFSRCLTGLRWSGHARP